MGLIPINTNPVLINGVAIDKVKSIKYLGVMINEQVNEDEHINNRIEKF